MAIYPNAIKTPTPKLIERKLTIQPAKPPNTVLKALIVSAELVRPDDQTPLATMHHVMIKQNSELTNVLIIPKNPLVTGSRLPVKPNKIAAVPKPDSVAIIE